MTSWLANMYVVVASGAACAASSPPYSIGMMNWLEQPITDSTDRAAFIQCCTSTSAPTVAGGWIIQEAAGVVQGSTLYGDLDDYLTAVDAAGLHVSLNYGDDDWTNASGHDTASVSTNVQNLLTYLAQCPVTLSTNVGSGGLPTVDINLDVEPKGAATASDWVTMATHVRGLITTHNASSPNVHATLSGFINANLLDELDDGNLMPQAWQQFDSLIVMAYRNLPCFTAQCSGTDAMPCADGFARSGSKLASTTPAGKYCAIALELALDVGNCNKISFGTTGIYEHPGAADPATYRTGFLQTAMAQGWNLMTATEQSRFHPHGAYIMHSYQWFSCFRDGVQATGGGACQPTGSCDDTTACIPTLSTHLGDMNGDGTVDVADLELLQSMLGTCSGDLDHNGRVDVSDLLELIHRWGTCP